jgi:hypothetical protein
VPGGVGRLDFPRVGDERSTWENWADVTRNPFAPPMTIQENITPPVRSPCVSIMAIREPSGVLHQDRALA